MRQVYNYKKNDMITTKIIVDYTNSTVNIENYTNNLLDTAFGINQNPTLSDFEHFLEDRCFPKNRDMLKLHLKQLNLDYYDPHQIIAITKGKLEGDQFSIELEDEREVEEEYDDR